MCIPHNLLSLKILRGRFPFVQDPEFSRIHRYSLVFASLMLGSGLQMSDVRFRLKCELLMDMPG